MANATKMRDSLLILAFFVLGVLLARLEMLPAMIFRPDASLWALWLFMCLVGISIGSDRKLAEIMRTLRPQTLLLPLGTTVGTFAGAACASLFIAWPLADCLAAGAGFGYYSLSSIFITRYKGPDLGTVALVANVLREMLTLLLAPLLARFFGAAALVSCGGCTTVDTTLPVIVRYGGRDWILPAIIHAMTLDFSVPFWVTIFCSM